MKHTPTPWHVSQGESTKFTDANGNTIGGVSHTHLNGRRPVGEVEANAAFIVRACNSHDGLVADVAFLLDYASKARNALLMGQPVTHVDLDDLDSIRMRLRQAEGR